MSSPALFAIAALVACRIALEADALLKSEDDPAMLADRALDGEFDQALSPSREIEAALAANDADLANSFLDLGARAQRGGAQPRLPTR